MIIFIGNILNAGSQAQLWKIYLGMNDNLTFKIK